MQNVESILLANLKSALKETSVCLNINACTSDKIFLVRLRDKEKSDFLFIWTILHHSAQQAARIYSQKTYTYIFPFKPFKSDYNLEL